MEGSDFQKMIYNNFPLRDYFSDFFSLITQVNIHRAVIMMGQRRVGKTVILYQSIYKLIKSGVNPKRIFFVSLDTPILVNMPLQNLYELLLSKNSKRR
ncbi:MAG: AAA family ATPase [Proteobacteria bacterium]|nr:AAA family ATPase [Pseudomonadota bacterium]